VEEIRGRKLNMVNPKLYLNIAKILADESHATRLQVGAVIFDEVNNDVVSTGVNGTPTGFHTNECECPLTNKTKPIVVHAEQNAICKAAKAGKSTAGMSIAITHSPCQSCASMIAQSGIKKVYFGEAYRDASGIDMLKSLDVQVYKFLD
jgi:dCMP deaminase